MEKEKHEKCNVFKVFRAQCALAVDLQYKNTLLVTFMELQHEQKES